MTRTTTSTARTTTKYTLRGRAHRSKINNQSITKTIMGILLQPTRMVRTRWGSCFDLTGVQLLGGSPITSTRGLRDDWLGLGCASADFLHDCVTVSLLVVVYVLHCFTSPTRSCSPKKRKHTDHGEPPQPGHNSLTRRSGTNGATWPELLRVVNGRRAVLLLCSCCYSDGNARSGPDLVTDLVGVSITASLMVLRRSTVEAGPAGL